MREILKGKQSKKWMDDSQQISKSDYREWAGTDTNTSFLFATLDARVKEPAEMKFVRGFIYIYSEREENLELKDGKKWPVGAISQRALCLGSELCRAPLPDGMQSGSGLMSSSLRQCCLQVQMLLNSPERPEVILFAFVHPDNIHANVP